MNQVTQMLLMYVLFIIITITLALITGFSKIKGCSKVVKEKRIKSKKCEALVYAIIAVLAIFWTSYCSLDLIKQDYVVEDIKLVSYGKGNVISVTNAYMFDTGRLYSFAEDGKNYALKKGTTYKVTYAHRTSTIINIEGETKTAGLKTIFESGSIQDILVVSLFLIVYLVLRYLVFDLRYSKPKPKWKTR